MNFDYPTHLQLDKLLNLQKPVSSNETDELFFIIIHQVYELLFKAILHELDNSKKYFKENDLESLTLVFKRCTLIMRTNITQLDTLRTMSPMRFNKFRYCLGNASGLQSYQYREIEFLLGYKRKEIISIYQNHKIGYEALLKRLNSPSLITFFYDLLEYYDADIPKELREIDVKEASMPNYQVQLSIIKIYNQHYTFRILCDEMLNLDEVFIEWRDHHRRLVERTIGHKIGTGGSIKKDKVRMIQNTRFFEDLWLIRDKL